MVLLFVMAGGHVRLMFPGLCTAHLCQCLDPYAIENRQFDHTSSVIHTYDQQDDTNLYNVSITIICCTTSFCSSLYNCGCVFICRNGVWHGLIIQFSACCCCFIMFDPASSFSFFMIKHCNDCLGYGCDISAASGPNFVDGR